MDQGFLGKLMQKLLLIVLLPQPFIEWGQSLVKQMSLPKNFELFLMADFCITWGYHAVTKSTTHPFQSLFPTASQASASSLHRLAKAFRDDSGCEIIPVGAQKHASRAAHRFIGRWGLAWKVPRSRLEFSPDGSSTNVQSILYIKPSHYIKYFLQHAPEIVLAGCSGVKEAGDHFSGFWKAYAADHPQHCALQRPDLLGKTIPLCVHGDEGRGLRKGNTTAVTLEVCLGPDCAARLKRGLSFDGCEDCELREREAKRFRLETGKAKPVDGTPPVCSFQVSNMKRHSFLTKYPLILLPNTQYKDHPMVLKKLLEAVCDDLKDLCENGVQVGTSTERVYGGFCGMKGDMKWFAEKICVLDRCMKRVSNSNIPMCHECMAGDNLRPFEDISLNAAWCASQYTNRPWKVNEEPSFTRVPFSVGQAEPERCLRRDLFHNGKIGQLRDFVGSTIRVLAYMKYFNGEMPGDSNKVDVVLSRAHSHFAFWCATSSTTKYSPKLRSFTPVFLNCTTRRKYPWVNCHGSDCKLLLMWLRTFTAGALVNPLSPSDVEVLRVMHDTCAAALDWLHHLYYHGCFWNKHCGATFFQHMWAFLKGYAFLAKWCLQTKAWAAYGLKPKFHMLDHTKHDILVWLRDTAHPYFPSPILWSCDSNEDMIGRLSRYSRRVSPMLTTQRCLDLYMIKGKCLYKAFMAETKAARALSVGPSRP